jgi:hypothetical protein
VVNCAVNCVYTGYTQKNGAVLIVNTIKTAPLFCVCPVHILHYCLHDHRTTSGKIINLYIYKLYIYIQENLECWESTVVKQFSACVDRRKLTSFPFNKIILDTL